MLLKGCKLQEVELQSQLSSNPLLLVISSINSKDGNSSLTLSHFKIEKHQSGNVLISQEHHAHIHTHLLAVSYELPGALLDLLVFLHSKAPFYTRLKLISHFDEIVPFKPWPRRLYILSEGFCCFGRQPLPTALCFRSYLPSFHTHTPQEN